MRGVIDIDRKKHIKWTPSVFEKLVKKYGYKLLRIKYTDYKDIHKVISNYIDQIYPYRYNNIFYKSKNEMLGHNTIEANAIAFMVDKYRTKKNN